MFSQKTDWLTFNSLTVPACDIFFLHKVNMFITLTFESSTAKSPAQKQKYGKILNTYLVVRFKICLRFLKWKLLSITRFELHVGVSVLVAKVNETTAAIEYV